MAFTSLFTVSVPVGCYQKSMGSSQVSLKVLIAIIPSHAASFSYQNDFITI
jgi:hypothetical protein